jgi:hypothetical protein
VSLE